MERSGHFSPLEEPQQLAAAVSQFISHTPAAPTRNADSRATPKEQNRDLP